MRTAETEREMPVGLAADVKPVGVGELILVAIARDVPERDLVARADRLGRAARRPAWPCGGSAAVTAPSAGSPRPWSGSSPGSASSRSRCAGCSSSVSSPFDIAWRVVSLPAVTSSRKKRSNSCSVRRSPSISASISRVVRSSRGSRRRSRRQRVGVGEHLRRRRARERAGARTETRSASPCGELAGVVGVGVAEHPVAELDEVAPVLERHAHQLAQDPHRQLDRDLVDEVELALGERAVEHFAEHRADPILVGVDDADRERLGDDVAQAPVLGRIGVEHRHPRLHLLGRQVHQRGAARLGREASRSPWTLRGCPRSGSATRSRGRHARPARTPEPRCAAGRTTRAGLPATSGRDPSGRRRRARHRRRRSRQLQLELAVLHPDRVHGESECRPDRAAPHRCGRRTPSCDTGRRSARPRDRLRRANTPRGVQMSSNATHEPSCEPRDRDLELADRHRVEVEATLLGSDARPLTHSPTVPGR